MYTRRFHGRDIQIPKNYHGTAFEESEEEFEENISAEDEIIMETASRPSPSHEVRESDDAYINTCASTEHGEYTPPVVERGDENEKHGGILSHLGLGDMEFSDILLLLLVVLLMKEQSEDTELPILLLLLLLS